MAPTIDLKFAALRGLGFTGTLSDMVLQWLQDNGATASTTPDAWLEYLAIELDTDATGVLADDWYAFLVAEGYSGTVSDMENQFWQAQVDALP